MDNSEEIKEFDESVYWLHNLCNELPNIMLTGISGSGKSSLINEIVGDYVSPVTEELPSTKNFHIIKGDDYGKNVNFVDIAGYVKGKGKLKAYFKKIRGIVEKGLKKTPIHIIWYCIPINENKICSADIVMLRNLCAIKCLKKRVVVIFTKKGENNDETAMARYKRVLTDKLDFPIPCYYSSDIEDILEYSKHLVTEKDMDYSIKLSELNSRRRKARGAIATAFLASGTIGAAPIRIDDSILLGPTQELMLSNILKIYELENYNNYIVNMFTNGSGIKGFARVAARKIRPALKSLPMIGTKTAVIKAIANAGVAGVITAVEGVTISELAYEGIKKYISGKTDNLDNIFIPEIVNKRLIKKLPDVISGITNAVSNKKNKDKGDKKDDKSKSESKKSEKKK